MQDNEFEKQVHRKLEGLSIEAGDSVWERVEERLDKKEKRRRWFIWFPVGITGILLSALLLLNRNEKNQNNDHAGKTAVAVHSKKQSPGKIISSAASQSSAPGDRSAVSEPTAAIRKAGSPGAGAGVVEPGQDKSFAERTLAEGPGKKEVRPGAGRNGRGFLPANSETKSSNIKSGAASLLSLNSTAAVPKGEHAATANEPLAALPEGAGRETAPEEAPATEKQPLPALPNFSGLRAQMANTGLLESHLASDGAVRLRRSVSKSQRLQWGISISAGRSGITSGKLSNFFVSAAANDVNYAAVNFSNSIVRTASKVRPGAGGSIGFFLQQPMGNHFFLKAAVNYSLYTSLIKVGAKMTQTLVLRSSASMADKSVDTYFTAENNRNYTNRYHFLELPVSLGISLAEHSRLPLAWELGVAPSVLIASNALNFNPGSSIYYRDNALFKKMQTQIFTSLPLTVYSGHGYALQLAPFFRYNTSFLFKPSVNEQKHLAMSGLSARISFVK